MAEAEERALNREPTDEERQKWLAEARKADAEAQKFLSEARKSAAEASQAESALAIAVIAQEKIERAYAEERAHNRYFHIYHYTSEINESSVSKCMDQLNIWHRLDPGCPIEVIFTSPGGSVMQGMVLFDYIQELRRQDHYVTTTALGYAASMAGVLLQAGNLRVMGREAYLLIHEVSAVAVGKIGEMEDEMKFLRKIQERVVNIFVERGKISRAAFKSHWTRKDWWLSSSDCLRYGFVDEVR